MPQTGQGILAVGRETGGLSNGGIFRGSADPHGFAALAGAVGGPRVGDVQPHTRIFPWKVTETVGTSSWVLAGNLFAILEGHGTPEGKGDIIRRGTAAGAASWANISMLNRAKDAVLQAPMDASPGGGARGGGGSPFRAPCRSRPAART